MGKGELTGQLKTQTDANCNVTKYEYNALNQVRKTTTPGDATIPSNTLTYQYDKLGRLAIQTDSTGLIETFSCDNQGRLLSKTQQNADESEKNTTSTRYDKNGNARFATDGNGNTSENTYDELSRLKTASTTVNGVTKVTTYGYDADGNQTTVTDWRGNVSTNVYDALNRLIEKRDPYAVIQKLEYNKNNIQVKSFDALGNETKYLYDRNNRLIATADPEGHTTSQYYDDVGNIIAKNDGRNITTTYNYDEFNRLVSVENAKSEMTSYSYDLNGNMLTQTDGNGNTTTFEYNAANLLKRKIDQGGKAGSAYINAKTESYTYYTDGNMKNMTDRNGVTTSYAYDVFGRLTAQNTGKLAIGYTYDRNGNQLTVTDGTGTTTRVYDEQNRVVSKTVPVFGKTAYTYDGIEPNGGYSETTTDPKGNVVKKVYDKAGRLANVIAGGDKTTYIYNNDGSRKSVIYNSGAKEEYTYYNDGLVKTLINKKADGTVIDSYTYTYDAAHNQVTKSDSKGLTSYTYDSLERLESVTEPNGRVSGYTFDAAGNRLTETVSISTSAAITTYSYNEQNRLEKTVTNDGGSTVTVNYAYDNNGNMISKSTETAKPVDPTATGTFNLYKAGTTTGSAVVLYRYDAFNQLIEAVTDDKTEKYVYNGDGYRVAKNDNGNITNYLYEADKVILETDDSGNQTAQNVYGLNLISRTSNLDKLYYMYNGHADVTALIAANGTVAASYYYDAFGNILEQSGNTSNNITYAGYQYDSETGLYYLNSRYYDSKVARFLSEDTYTGNPNDPLSLNHYTYCHNEPIMYTDPTGHWEAGDENLSSEDQQAIIEATDDWNDAKDRGDQAGMDAAHKRAKEIRDNAANRGSTDSGDSSGNSGSSSSGSSESSSSSSSSASKALAKAIDQMISSNGYPNDKQRADLPTKTGYNKDTNDLTDNSNYTNDLLIYLETISITTSATNLDDYINSYYNGLATVALCVESPNPNSRDCGDVETGTDGKPAINTGHTFLRIDDGYGNVTYIGLAAKEKGAGMLLGAYDVEGWITEDSNHKWDTAEVFTLNSCQFQDLKEYINDKRENVPQYDIDDFNCTSFALDALTNGAGLHICNIQVYEHDWQVPQNASELLGKVYPQYPGLLINAAVARLDSYYGYTPGDAAQDIKNRIGGKYITFTNGYVIEHSGQSTSIGSRSK